MAEPRRANGTGAAPATAVDRALNQHTYDFFGNRWELAADYSVEDEVKKAVGKIDFNALVEKPEIAIKSGRYNVPVRLQKEEPYNRHFGYDISITQALPTKRPTSYRVTLSGGDEVQYLDTIDLSKTTEAEAKKYIRGEMEKYVKKWLLGR